jgi:predicted tellurium resistance membrane protein TerC
MFDIFLHPESWIALLTLTLLEIILGVDNLVFLTVITARLPKSQQKVARQAGLLMACIMRLLLLAAITWLTRLVHPLFTLFSHAFSIRDLVLIGGGVFLLAKATSEIHASVIVTPDTKLKQHLSFMWVIVQVMLLDIIFSLDSVITAVGMAQDFIIMAIAIIIAVAMMLWASTPLSNLINKYPTLKMLALSFLILVGMVLVADGFGIHVPRPYLYFAIAFSLLVEVLNIFARKKRRNRGNQLPGK